MAVRADLEGRISAAERAAGIRRGPDPLAVQQAKALADWLVATTGKTIEQMSCDELRRLEQLFRDHADSGEEMGDDVADLVLGCMDVNQTVIDLDQRRQQLDRGPWR